MSDGGIEQVSSQNKVTVVTNTDCKCCSGNLPLEIENCRKEQTVDPKKVQHIAGHIRREDGIEFRDKRLKHCLADGLTTKAEGIISVEDESDVLNLLNQGVKSDLDAAKRIADRKSDGNLSVEDKKYVASKLKESLDKTKSITENPSYSSLLGSALSGLYTWCCNTIRFLSDWCNEDKEEERRKEQELCTQRQEEKKELIKYCGIMKNAKRKRIQLCLYLEHVRSKMLQAFWAKEYAKSHDTKKCHYAKNELSQHGANFDYAKSKYLEEGLRESFYEDKENDIRSSLPPSTVCDPLGMNLELDILC